MEFGVLFYLSVLFFSGLFFGRMAKHCKLPNVTGYLVGGLIMGPSVLGIVPEDVISSMSIVSSMALGFIAFSIGGEFKMSFFRRVGFTPIVIAIFEAVTAVVLVVIGLVVVGYSLPFSLVLGAIAAATAPAWPWSGPVSSARWTASTRSAWWATPMLPAPRPRRRAISRSYRPPRVGC